jgi:hypothetical protein
MPPEPKKVEDFSPYYLEAKRLTSEHDFTVLIGDRKFAKAADRLYRASIALERASHILNRMEQRKQNETKRTR